MRSFRHWTPRYLWNRLCEKMYRKTHPDRPWLTKSANAMLSSLLKESDVGLEFGSGRSTLWFARRVAALTSVEHDPAWYEPISSKIKQSGISNVTYLMHQDDHDHVDARDSAYVQVTEQFGDSSLDFVLVDGLHRDACANAALRRIRPGGLLLIDDCNWFLPSQSLCPNSRTPDQGPSSPAWDEFLAQVKRWRYIWTSNGVKDTVIYFKPCCP